MAKHRHALNPRDNKPSKQTVIITVVMVIVFIIAGFVIKAMIPDKSSSKKPVMNVKLLPDTPPPPPPPPPPPKEQPKQEVKQEVKQEIQPSQQLKTDEAGSDDGSSPLASGPVTKDFDPNDLKQEPKLGARASLAKFSWYTASIKGHIEDALAKDKALANGKYSVVVHLWIEADARIRRAELVGSSGDPETDKLIRAALASMPPMNDAPPDDMPQPVKLRVTARTAG